MTTTLTYYRVGYPDSTRTRRLRTLEEAKSLAELYEGSIYVFYEEIQVMNPIAHAVHSLRVWWRKGTTGR